MWTIYGLAECEKCHYLWEAKMPGLYEIDFKKPKRCPRCNCKDWDDVQSKKTDRRAL